MKRAPTDPKALQEFHARDFFRHCVNVRVFCAQHDRMGSAQQAVGQYLVTANSIERIQARFFTWAPNTTSKAGRSESTMRAFEIEVVDYGSPLLKKACSSQINFECNNGGNCQGNEQGRRSAGAPGWQEKSLLKH